jgi:ATP-dependent protease ClpP protease subunit
MKAVIHIQGVIGKDANLLGVIRQFKSFKNPTEVEVQIDSVGGDVDEGMSIFNYLRGLGLPITTKSSKAYSIAASIFMAGDIRLLEEGANRFMIHMPWGRIEGGSAQLDAASAQLKEIEDEFTQFYSIYTNVDEPAIRRLLENETFMSATEAMELGIATGTYSTLKAVAFYKEDNNDLNNDKTMTKAEKLIKAFGEFLNGKDAETETKAEEIEVLALILQDANGDEVEFPELNENELPEQGAKVMRDGQPAEGEILMPDGSKIIAANGVVSEVVAAPEVDETEEEQTEDETVEIPKQVEEAEDALPVDVPLEEVEPIEDEIEPIEEEIDILTLLEELEKSLLKKVSAQFKEREDALNAQIVALKKEIGSSIENEPTQPINNKKSNTGNFLTNALRK